jgi:hypothetical protein
LSLASIVNLPARRRFHTCLTAFGVASALNGRSTPLGLNGGLRPVLPLNIAFPLQRRARLPDEGGHARHSPRCRLFDGAGERCRNRKTQATIVIPLSGHTSPDSHGYSFWVPRGYLSTAQTVEHCLNQQDGVARGFKGPDPRAWLRSGQTLHWYYRQDGAVVMNLSDLLTNNKLNFCLLTTAG